MPGARLACRIPGKTSSALRSSTRTCLRAAVGCRVSVGSIVLSGGAYGGVGVVERDEVCASSEVSSKRVGVPIVAVNGGGAPRTQSSVSGHAAVNDVQRVGVSILSAFTKVSAEWIATRIATAPNLWVFVGVRRQPKIGAELQGGTGADTHGHRKRHWGSSGRRFKSCQPGTVRPTTDNGL